MHPADWVEIRERQLNGGKGFTQEELAAKLGMSANTLGRLERQPGKIKLHHQLALERLQEIQPPKRYYIIDQVERTITPCTRAMIEAANAVPVYNDSLVSFYMVFPGGVITWAIPMARPRA